MKHMNSTQGNIKGIGFTEVLTVAFIVLKLCNVIDWSWIWILSPIWISIILRAIISVAVDKLFTDNFNT